MKNKKTVFLSLFLKVLSINVFANVNFNLEITGIEENNGKIHVKIFSNEIDYKNNNPYEYFIFESSSFKMIYDFNIPEGEYLIVMFQDTNNNGVLDTNFFGIPKEPSAISNYTGGIPVGWKKHKFQISNNSNKILINLRRA